MPGRHEIGLPDGIDQSSAAKVILVSSSHFYMHRIGVCALPCNNQTLLYPTVRFAQLILQIVGISGATVSLNITIKLMMLTLDL